MEKFSSELTEKGRKRHSFRPNQKKEEEERAEARDRCQQKIREIDDELSSLEPERQRLQSAEYLNNSGFTTGELRRIIEKIASLEAERKDLRRQYDRGKDDCVIS